MVSASRSTATTINQLLSDYRGLTRRVQARYQWDSHLQAGRGSQVVRQRSAKPLFVGSTPIRASKILAGIIPVINRFRVHPGSRLLPRHLGDSRCFVPNRRTK